ncbi:MAG: hypothetical protein ACYDDV_04025 [Methanoregula sp.]
MDYIEYMAFCVASIPLVLKSSPVRIIAMKKIQVTRATIIEDPGIKPNNLLRNGGKQS